MTRESLKGESMTLTEIQQALAAAKRRPTRSLGQNFLHDQNLARWIVAQLKLSPGDHVVEIGPGLGALTEYLVASGVSLTLIEKDQHLADYLAKKFVGEAVE